MGISRIVNTDFWTDGLVIDSFTPEDKYFMLYLLTNPHSRQAGIYKLNKKIAAFETGYSLETISTLIERFSTKYKRIAYSEKTQEVAIFNYMKFSIMKGGKPVYDCIEKDLDSVKDRGLIYLVYESLQEYFESSGKESISYIGTLFKKYADNYIQENLDTHITNDNDNDNDSIVDVSSHESSTSRNSKIKTGEFNNVLLTADELEKLKVMFFDWKDRIEKLSEYMASHGKKYKNHYATILSWSRKDSKQEDKQYKWKN